MKEMIKSTYNKNVGGSFGDFGGSYHIDTDILDGIDGIKNPINPNTGKSCFTLVSSTDGVGTKSIMIQKLINVGVNCFRVNLSHGTSKEKKKYFNLLKRQ